MLSKALGTLDRVLVGWLEVDSNNTGVLEDSTDGVSGGLFESSSLRSSLW